MRSSTRLLAILFVLILSGMAIAAQIGDEYLEHIYVVRGDELTVYADPELTKFGNSTEVILVTVDRFFKNDDSDWVAHISEPEHLEGYVAINELIEVMAVWSDTLNIRKEAGLSADGVRTVKRGELVIYLEPTLTSPEFGEDDSYLWRNCVIDGGVGWVVEDFLIEKCYFDALEPALELYDSGELRNMRSYLEKLDRNYADIDCEIASDDRSAVVTFEGVDWYGPHTRRLYLVGEADKMIYSNDIHDYFISDDGRYTYVLYSFVSYGWGYNQEHPYTVFDNYTGEEVFDDYVFTHSLDHLQEKYSASQLHAAELIDKNHLLIIEHYPEDSGEFFPCLILIDLTTSESVLLLEPNMEILETEDLDAWTGIRLRQNSNCYSPSPIIEAAMKTNLFHLCEEELVRGFTSEG